MISNPLRAKERSFVPRGHCIKQPKKGPSLFLSDGFNRTNLGAGSTIGAFFFVNHVGLPFLNSLNKAFFSTVPHNIRNTGSVFQRSWVKGANRSRWRNCRGRFPKFIQHALYHCCRLSLTKIRKFYLRDTPALL